MRKHLLAVVLIAVCGSSSAFAKPGVYNWNGFYIGAHAGAIWGDVNVTDDVNDGVPPGPFGYSISGFIGGGTAGYTCRSTTSSSASKVISVSSTPMGPASFRPPRLHFIRTPRSTRASMAISQAAWA